MSGLKYCMTRFAVCFGVTAALLFAVYAEANTLKYNPPMAENDAQKSYFVTLLKRVCEQAKALDIPCELSPVDVVMFQQRQLKSLDKGLLDVMWTMTSVSRENDYLPVRIPLTKGLIGYRIAVVHNHHASAFNADASVANIKKLQHVQGHDWPDTEILRFNGFEVSTTSWYSSLYKALDDHHYDVLLRGALEVSTEFALYPTQQLSVDMNHAFYYPSAIYFFVSKSRPELAAMFSKGLIALKTTGEFDQLLFEFPPHANAFKRLSLGNRKVHLLENPLLPEETPLDNPELWFVNDLINQARSDSK